MTHQSQIKITLVDPSVHATTLSIGALCTSCGYLGSIGSTGYGKISFNGFPDRLDVCREIFGYIIYG